MKVLSFHTYFLMNYHYTQYELLMDCPIDGGGESIKMSCEYVKVQEGHNKIIFPEPPKLKIIDEYSSSCSEYLTKNLPWFAYAGEHKLLKYQELIKHIVAAE